MKEAPEAPRRRVVCVLEIGADSRDDLVMTLEDIARRVGMDDLTEKGFSAGYNSSYNYKLDEDESVTHESWSAALADLVKRNKATG